MNVIVDTDLWFPIRQTPSWPVGIHHSGGWPDGCDPLRYVAWVDPGRGNDELAPRLALHVTVTP